jgi:predicted HTH transcriptional regulator
MNSSGGTLVIGVHDGSGELRGLERDIATLGRKDLDGYEQLLRQIFNNMLGPENSTQIGVSFPSLDGHTTCVVRAPRSPRPVYARAGSDADFYIRDGNTTRRLNSEETVRYCSDHFGIPA